MKKIIVLIMSVFILFSCSNEVKNIDVDSVEINTVDIIDAVDMVDVVDNDTSKTIIISEIKNTLDKIDSETDISIDELSMISSMTTNLLSSYIEEKAINENDKTICDSLDNKYACIFRVVQEDAKNSEKVELCNVLEEESAVSNCKINTIEFLANKNKDANLCDKLVDDSEDKIIINSCKNKIFMDIAIEFEDKKECNKISDENEKDICIEMIEMNNDY